MINAPVHVHPLDQGISFRRYSCNLFWLAAVTIKSFQRKTVAQAKGASGEAWMGGATPGESSKALCFLIRPSRNPFHMPRRKATGDGRVFRGMHLTALRIAKVISNLVSKLWVYYSVRTFKCLGSKSRLWNSFKADYK